MTKLLRLVLIPSISLALLSACNPRAEEETSLAPAEDLSATEIIDRILEAEKAISSIQEERTEVSTTLADPLGEADMIPEETRALRIQVGEDLYLKDEYAVEPGPCETDPSCEDSFSPFDETLYYQGTTYYRDSSGGWILEPESGCLGADTSGACFSARLPIEHWEGVDGTSGSIGTGGFVDTAECPALESIEPSVISPVYSFQFSWLTNPQRIETRPEDRGLIHIRGVIEESFWSFPLTPEIEAIYAECGIEPPNPFEGIEVPEYIRDFIPERYEGVADLWVDPASFFVQRIEWTLNSFNKERQLQGDTTTSRYSLFNEAELPGPLPK